MIPTEHCAKGSGQGKIILCGEHAVVYGYPAIALGLSCTTTVTLSAKSGPTELESGEAHATLATVIQQQLPAEGLRIAIESDVPIGKGMGSSAALAVALVRARASVQRTPLSEAQTFQQSLAIEKLFHGNPSGLDNTVAALGGVLRFEKGPPPTVTRLPMPNWSLVILDAGTAPATKEMVQQVALGFPSNSAVIEQIGALSEAIAANLEDQLFVASCMNENQALLVELGVSSEPLDTMVAWARNHGAVGAKLSGAGGGGMVIALSLQPQELLKEVEKAGISALHTRPWIPT